MLPLGWTHSYEYLTQSDSLVVTLTFAPAALDSCIERGAEAVCVRNRPGLVSAVWESGPDDGLVWYFSATTDDPTTAQIDFLGFDRPGLRGFYEPPIPWVPMASERTVGSGWTWNGELDSVGEPISLEYTVVATDDVLDLPVRPFPLTTTQIAEVEPLPGLAYDWTGRVATIGSQKKNVAPRWYHAFNDRVCVLVADEVLTLLDLIDDQGGPVSAPAQSWSAFKRRFGPR